MGLLNRQSPPALTKQPRRQNSSRLCPLCERAVTDDGQRCPDCGSLHHEACWRYCGGCAIFACQAHHWGVLRHHGVEGEVARRLDRWHHLARVQWLLGATARSLLLVLLLGVFITIPVLPGLLSDAVAIARLYVFPGYPFLVLTIVVLAAELTRLLLHGPILALRKLVESDIETRLSSPDEGEFTELEEQLTGGDDDKVNRFVRIAIGTIGLSAAIFGGSFLKSQLDSAGLILGLWGMAGYFSWVLQRRLVRERRSIRARFAGLHSRLRQSTSYHEALKQALPPSAAAGANTGGARAGTGAAGAGTMPASTNAGDGSCPVCGCAVRDDDESVACHRCATPHHRECWDYTGGCAIFGCSKRGWTGRFDPALFNRIRSMADRWISLFRYQWTAFGAAVAGIFFAVLSQVLPIGWVATPLLVVGLLVTGGGLLAYLALMPKTTLLQHSLERELRTPLEPPQHRARQVIARVALPAIEEDLAIVVQLVTIVSAILVVVLPLAAAALGPTYGAPPAFLHIVALFVSGVLMPYASLIASQKRTRYVESVRNRLKATFNVFRRDPQPKIDKK